MTILEKTHSNDHDDELLFSEDDEELCFVDDEDSDEKQSDSGKEPQNSWEVLIVDDDVEVHHITKRVLCDFSFEGKGLILHSAYSIKEAKAVLKTHPNLAMILLDVVMEEDDSGLKFAEYVRNEFSNHLVRIVLRTGQPGQAPEQEVIVKYDINDYQQKSELTAQKLFTVMVSSLRSFRELTVNLRLQTENMRLASELNITRCLQKMLLPTKKELQQVEGLEIAVFLEPANEVGGDYYDVQQHKGHVLCGIGDVTGHGLESGVLAIMIQMGVRTLFANNETDPVKFLSALNEAIYNNVQRMNCEKNLTLALLNYQDGQVSLSGQHENMIVVRNGEVELIDTIDLGFPIGLEENISDFIAQTQLVLNAGDVVVLYTDGITEAINPDQVQYGLEQLCEVIKQNWQRTVDEIQQAVVVDVKQFIGTQKVYDDMTLLVLKQK